MKTEFAPVDYDYFDFNGKNYVKLIGRNNKGEKICVVDSYEPNFWLILEDKANPDEIIKKIKNIKIEKAARQTKILKTEIYDKKYLGKKVKALQVFVTNHKDMQDIASEIGDMEGIYKRREYDIPLITKYIKEKNIEPLKQYSIEGNIIDINEFGGIVNGLDLDTCILAEKIEPSKNEKEFLPKILAYDIETTGREIGKGEVLMISLYGQNIKKVLTWKKCKDPQDYIEFCNDEADMIEKFVKHVNQYDPDILTGYFSDGFDLPYLKAAAEKNKIKLDLGIDRREPTFSRGRIPAGKISGIVHIDLYRFIQSVFAQYLQSETLSLNEVAKELVGEQKEDFDFKKLANMQDKDWKDFFSYNMQDSSVTYKLAEKIWPDILEFTRIVKEPLFDTTRDGMATHVENYMIHNLDQFDEIAEKKPMANEIGERRAKGKYEGAFVFEPVPGLYDNIVMFDFTSMYASVIVTYNLSKATLTEKGDFQKQQGFFPIMLNEIIEKRKTHKLELAKNPSGILRARSNAYKLLANAAYGYQGFFGARYYCREAAAATAKFAKENILSTIDTIEKEGFKIIYSDTDSIAFLQGDKNKEQVLNFLKKINSKLPGIMELDLEDFYSRGLFVTKRGTTTGAKKKYALVDEKGKIKIRGFETVRRDWCRLTRDLQSKILKTILEDGNEKTAVKILKDVVEKLKTRKIDINDLIIRTQLHRPLEEYLAEGPHVVAAKKMKVDGTLISTGMLIEYFIGEGSGKRIGDRVHLAGESVKYDIDYYLKNQILPAVENILDVFGVDARAISDGESQKKLF
jgi:DNA polymerase, archaea type